MMRITKLQRIKQLLDNIVRNKNHIIYIAPLNKAHYNRYIEIINSNYNNQDIYSLLTNQDILIEATGKIDVRIDLLMDTNLYVMDFNKKEIEYDNELLLFLNKNNVDYKLILGDLDLILALENKPNDKFNTNEQ